MPLIKQKWIYRADLRRNPEWRYVFGDNVQRAGFGGQAKEMRGEPNAIGVATKWKPTMDLSAFFDDGENCRFEVLRDLRKIEAALKEGRVVVVPEDGIGTGLSRLPQRAPKLNAMIQGYFDNAAQRFPMPAKTA